MDFALPIPTTEWVPHRFRVWEGALTNASRALFFAFPLQSARPCGANDDLEYDTPKSC